jgi:hypothetical protein
MTIEVPMRFESEPLLWIVNDVYSQQECANFIKFIRHLHNTIKSTNML